MKIKIFSVFYLFFAFVLIYFIIVPFFVLNNPDIQLAYYFPRNNESFGGASILMINNAILVKVSS
jgi:hypothetical protein